MFDLAWQAVSVHVMCHSNLSCQFLSLEKMSKHSIVVYILTYMGELAVNYLYNSLLMASYKRIAVN